MVILGVTHPISYNNAACILIDGKIAAFIEEERLNRIKYSPNMAARESISFCLKETGLKLSDIDIIAVGFCSAEQLFNAKLKKCLFALSVPDLKTMLKEKSVVQYYENLLPFDVKDPRVLFVRHHLAHAASAFYLSGFEEANILSWDGSGGQEAGLLLEGKINDLKIIEAIDNFQSWGLVWESITEKLGFRKHGDEGKVMGLAAYGTPVKRGFNFIDKSGDFPKVDRLAFGRFITKVEQRDKNEPLKEYHKNLASTLQKETENAAEKMLHYLFLKNKVKNFCISGGVGLNCSANGYVLQLPFVENLFVQPVSQDAGTALGAAVYAYIQKTKMRPKIELNHLYYGSSYSNRDIEIVLKNSKITSFSKEKNIEKKTAELLAGGKIIGWFQGKMEVGSRALGNRSILADPRNIKIKDEVNLLKGRELWRPLSPSVLEEEAPNFLEGKYQKSPFMIMAYQARKEKIKEMPATIHVDGSCRPQTVSKMTNLRYWTLISEFKKLTGVPVILNTSFNLAGEPIVESPKDAISTFFRSPLDFLALDDFLVWKV